jgi:hypothetical protein
MTDPKNGGTAPVQPRCAGGCGELVSALGQYCACCWPEADGGEEEARELTTSEGVPDDV